MATLEQVEKLREKANVSYEEAREALDAVGGDLLDALIYLEQQGKVSAPAGGGYYSSANMADHGAPSGEDRQNWNQQCRGTAFRDMMAKFGRFLVKLFRIGNTNFLVATKNGTELFACPVTAVVLLIAFFFWVTVPLLIVSLFFGLHYHFRGSELGTDGVNKVMDGAADAVEDLKKNLSGDDRQ